MNSSLQVKFAGPTNSAASSPGGAGRPAAGRIPGKRDAKPLFTVGGTSSFARAAGRISRWGSSHGGHAGPLFRHRTHGPGYGSCLAGVASSDRLQLDCVGNLSPSHRRRRPGRLRARQNAAAPRGSIRASISSAVMSRVSCGRPTQRGVGAATGLGSGKGGGQLVTWMTRASWRAIGTPLAWSTIRDLSTDEARDALDSLLSRSHSGSLSRGLRHHPEAPAFQAGDLARCYLG